MTSVRVLSRHMFLIRAELGFLGELESECRCWRAASTVGFVDASICDPCLEFPAADIDSCCFPKHFGSCALLRVPDDIGHCASDHCDCCVVAHAQDSIAILILNYYSTHLKDFVRLKYS